MAAGPAGAPQASAGEIHLITGTEALAEGFPCVRNVSRGRELAKRGLRGAGRCGILLALEKDKGLLDRSRRFPEPTLEAVYSGNAERVLKLSERRAHAGQA